MSQVLCTSRWPPYLSHRRRQYRSLLILVIEWFEEGARHVYVAIQKEWKFDTLGDSYEMLTIIQAIIYCTIRRKVIFLAGQIASPLHYFCDVCRVESEKRDLVMKVPFRFTSCSGSQLVCLPRESCEAHCLTRALVA